MIRSFGKSIYTSKFNIDKAKMGLKQSIRKNGKI